MGFLWVQIHADCGLRWLEVWMVVGLWMLTLWYEHYLSRFIIDQAWHILNSCYSRWIFDISSRSLPPQIQLLSLKHCFFLGVFIKTWFKIHVSAGNNNVLASSAFAYAIVFMTFKKMSNHISHPDSRWFKFKTSVFQRSRCLFLCFMSAAVTIYWLLLLPSNRDMIWSIPALSGNEIQVQRFYMDDVSISSNSFKSDLSCAYNLDTNRTQHVCHQRDEAH